MTYEEKKVVIEAAEVLKKYCGSMEDCEKDCIFRTGNGCYLSEDYPVDWYVPTLTRWSPEDVALAKAMKDKGVVEICVEDDVYCYDETRKLVMRICEILHTFEGAEKYMFVPIDTIIKEAEG